MIMKGGGPPGRLLAPLKRKRSLGTHSLNKVARIAAQVVHILRCPTNKTECFPIRGSTWLLHVFVPIKLAAVISNIYRAMTRYVMSYVILHF